MPEETYIETSEWEITQRGWYPERNRLYESIFSLGNGHIGLRGFFEEKYTGDSLKGTYTAGIFYPDKTRVGWWKNGYPEFFAKVLNNTNWAGIDVVLNGEELDFNSGAYTVEDFARRLDMRSAIYTRAFTIRDRAGRETRLSFSRFLSMDDTAAACVCLKATALNHDGDLLLRPYLDGNVRNEDANYDGIFWDRVSERSGSYPTVTMRTKKTRFTQACAMACDCRIRGESVPPSAELTREKYAGQEFGVRLGRGDSVELTKTVCLCTSRDIPEDGLEEACISKLDGLVRMGSETLLESHRAAMERMWALRDVRIEGDPEAQQGIRYNILQLMLTYTGTDSRLNIGPKGFTGEKYGGTTYWDTEAFCLPFYLYADPAVARNLLLYRYRHLEMARENARKLGLDGALYPMVTIDGRECHNEWEITFEEIHRNGAIAYAVYHYVKFTGDTGYLQEYGMEVLVELCRFWAARVTYNRKKGRYMLLGVTGPNEYENNVNNNFYTNTIAAWTLAYTLECLEKFAPPNMPGAKETAVWREIAQKMYYPFAEEPGVFEQNDLYMDKELLPADVIPVEERPINQHWSWDRVLRSCYIKQADVLQSLYFFPEKYSLEEQRRNFDFYEPMTVHESSLSASVYSIVASRIGYAQKAYELYMRTARLDLENVNNDTQEGLHITSMGATWDAIVQGFAGVDTAGERLVLDPHLPEKWSRLSFQIHFRGSWISVTIKKDAVELYTGDGLLPVLVRGQAYTLESEKYFVIKI